MLNKEYWYSLNELCEACKSNDDKLGLRAILHYIDYYGENSGLWKYTLAEAGINDLDLRLKFENNVLVPTNLGKLVSLIRARFGNNYVGKCDTDATFMAGISPLPEFIKTDEAKYFRDKFVGILVMNYEKYNKILNIYIAQENKLMDALKTGRTSSSHLDRAHSDNASHDETKTDDYTIEADGKNLHNDTPQTTDVIATLEGNQHVSDLDKSHAETSNEGSTEVHGVDASSGEVHDAMSGTEEVEMDSKYTMEKIAEIQDSYQEVLRRWSDEFAGLFIEEGNIC